MASRKRRTIRVDAQTYVGMEIALRALRLDKRVKKTGIKLPRCKIEKAPATR